MAWLDQEYNEEGNRQGDCGGDGNCKGVEPEPAFDGYDRGACADDGSGIERPPRSQQVRLRVGEIGCWGCGFLCAMSGSRKSRGQAVLGLEVTRAKEAGRGQEHRQKARPEWLAVGVQKALLSGVNFAAGLPGKIARKKTPGLRLPGSRRQRKDELSARGGQCRRSGPY